MASEIFRSKEEGLGVVQWFSVCLAFMKAWVHPSTTKEKKWGRERSELETVASSSSVTGGRM
jgi:hypothetical protein